MNVLSLFDGISCGRVALERSGVKVDNYFASEIHEPSIEISKKNYPDIIQLGDVVNIKGSDLPKIDLLIAGSPCQGFSLAGSKTNFEHEESKLFFEFVRLLKEIKPKYFFLENVNMRNEWKDIITSYVGVKPQLINSGMFSAQRRTRLYWTNIRTFDVLMDKYIKLKSIIDEEIDIDNSWMDGHPKEFISYAKVSGIENIKYKKKDLNIKEQFEREKKDILFRQVHPLNGKSSPVLTTSNCVRSFYGLGIYINSKVRNLTIIEAERLQTLPDDYTLIDDISEINRWAAVGNCWTVDVVVHFFNHIKFYETKGE